MEPIRHCDDLWIDAMVCVGFNLAHGSRQKMQSIFRTSRPLAIIFYLVFFLLVITIPNHSADFAGRRIQIWDAFYAAYVEVTNDKHFDRPLT